MNEFSSTNSIMFCHSELKLTSAAPDTFFWPRPLASDWRQPRARSTASRRYCLVPSALAEVAKEALGANALHTHTHTLKPSTNTCYFGHVTSM